MFLLFPVPDLELPHPKILLRGKPESFQWIFQGEGVLCEMSQIVSDGLEESLNLIVDCSISSPDRSPIHIFPAILQNCTKRIKRWTREVLKNPLLAVWESFPG
jgi:hypothetical protein